MDNEEINALLQYKNLYEVLMERFDLSMQEYREGKTDLPPDIRLLNISNKLLKEYRKGKDKRILELYKQMRRAAHKTHWKMLKLNYTKKNKNFINMV